MFHVMKNILVGTSLSDGPDTEKANRWTMQNEFVEWMRSDQPLRIIRRALVRFRCAWSKKECQIRKVLNAKQFDDVQR